MLKHFKSTEKVQKQYKEYPFTLLTLHLALPFVTILPHLLFAEAFEKIDIYALF